MAEKKTRRQTTPKAHPIIGSELSTKTLKAGQQKPTVKGDKSLPSPAKRKARTSQTTHGEPLLKKLLAKKDLHLKLANEMDITSEFLAFCQTIAILRHPEFGCPWDLEQDHKSLRPFMLEESYEASQAMGSENPKEICEELGDVLLQVVLNAQIACDNDQFSISDVMRGITRKMIARHPHVFLRPEKKSRLSPEQVLSKWEQVKTEEQKKTLGQAKTKGYFKQHGIDKIFPATTRAYKIGILAQKINFDWVSVVDVWKQLKSEILELEVEMTTAQSEAMTPELLHRIKDEIGDIYFTLAQLCRHLSLSPEVVASDANEKFLSRFQKIEALMVRDKKTLSQSSLEDLEKYWREAKKR